MRKHIEESNLIEGIDDPKEIKQSMVAWEYLLKQKELSHGVICRVQKIITLHQTDLQPWHKGYYRSVSRINVRVSSYVAPHYSLIDTLMSDWLSEYRDLTPFEAHRSFEGIHPFVDGNGRTGRMLMWWDELKRGGEPTLIDSNHREEYYKLLSGR